MPFFVVDTNLTVILSKYDAIVQKTVGEFLRIYAPIDADIT